MSLEPDFTNLTVLIASDAKVDSYGGFQFTEQQLIEKIESAIKHGQYFSFDHDPSTRTWVEITDGEIRTLDSGEKVAWITIKVPNDVYEEVKRRYEAGTLHGVSPNHFENINSWSDENPYLLIDADAEHWSADYLLEIIKPLEKFGPVGARKLYQFSIIPPAVALIQILGSQFGQIPPAIFSAFLYDLWRGCKSKEKILNIDVLRDNKKDVQISIKGSSDKLVMKAISNMKIYIEGDQERIIIEEEDED